MCAVEVGWGVKGGGGTELLHVLESLCVAAEPVQRVGAREPRALAVVLRVNGDGVRTRAGGPHPYPYPYTYHR